MKLKALVFDAYGTLFDVHSVAVSAEKSFPGRGKELSRVWRVSQLQYTWLRSLMGRYEDFSRVTEDALAFACKNLGVILSPEIRTELMDAYSELDPFPDVAGALRALSGIPLAILSNGSPSMLRAVVANSGLEGCFQKVISVDAVRVYKPSPRVYQLVVDEFRVAAHEIGFVSSNGWDVTGAASFGLTTYWINRSGGEMEELGFTHVEQLRTLTDLINVVEIV